LPESTRNYFETRFGYDFSGVRVNSDSRAAESARSINARAFTLGSNIVFGAGQYKPGSDSGNRLIAHELTHVVQQGGHGDAAQRAAIEAGVTTVTGTKESEDACAGWFVDHESTSKRAAEYYVRTELAGDRGAVKKIECDLFDPDTGAFACTVHFTDGTPIRVIVRRDAIIVGVYPLQTFFPPVDRPLCWYDYKCPGPNRDLVLTKRKCQTSKPAQGAPPPKAHGPEP
jgi:Domain of unknown function (DUF4157)